MGEIQAYQIVYLLLTIIFLPVHIMTIRIFLKYSEFRSNSFFRIIILLGFCNISQLILTGIIFLVAYTLYYPFFTENLPWFIRFCNSWGYFNPSSTWFLTLMLSLNRLTIFFKLYILTDYGNGEASWEKAANKMLYVLAALHTALNIPRIVQPNWDLFFDVKCGAKCYPWYDTLYGYFRFLSDYNTHYLGMTTLLIYMLICVIIKLPKKTHFDDALSKTRRKRERRILLLSAIECLLCIWVPWTSFISNKLEFKALWFSIFVSISQFTTWCVNPVMYFIGLPNFRAKFMADYVKPMAKKFSCQKVEPAPTVIGPLFTTHVQPAVTRAIFTLPSVGQSTK